MQIETNIGELEIYIYDEDHKPLKNVKVKLYDEEHQLIFMKQSDSNGNIKLSSVGVGNYVMQVDGNDRYNDIEDKKLVINHYHLRHDVVVSMVLEKPQHTKYTVDVSMFLLVALLVLFLLVGYQYVWKVFRGDRKAE